jgi:hypothetical protein
VFYPRFFIQLTVKERKEEKSRWRKELQKNINKEQDEIRCFQSMRGHGHQ